MKKKTTFTRCFKPQIFRSKNPGLLHFIFQDFPKPTPFPQDFPGLEILSSKFKDSETFQVLGLYEHCN